MTKELLQNIFPSTEIEVIELRNQCVTKPQVFDVYCFNEGDNDDSVIPVLKEDFENWFTGEFGIDGTREQFFSTYYDDVKTFEDDMLTYMLETKRECEASAIEYNDNWTSIFNSIAQITNPQKAA